MNASQHMRNGLARLVTLRERERERLQALLASQEQLRQRYLGTVQQLEQINVQIGASGGAQPLLAANSAQYKQAVLQWAQQQRDDLALHEAEMAVQRRAMLEATRKHEACGQLLARMDARWQHECQRREQKSQDDLAGQVWLRGKGDTDAQA